MKYAVIGSVVVVIVCEVSCLESALVEVHVDSGSGKIAEDHSVK